MSTPQFASIQLLRFVAAMRVVVMHTSEAISLRSAHAKSGDSWSGGAARLSTWGTVMVSACLACVWLERAMTRFLKRTLFGVPQLSFPHS